MDNRDVPAIGIPAAPKPDAREPFGPSFGDVPRRPAWRKPSSTPIYVGAATAGLWAGAAIAFAFGFLGYQQIAAMAWPWQAGLAAAILFPAMAFVFAGHLTWRASVLARMSDELAHIATRLVEPENAAGREVTRLGRAVRREIDALNAGFEAAAARARALDGLVKDRLRGIDDSVQALDGRGAALRENLSNERDAIEALSAALDAQAARAGELARARAAALRQTVDAALGDLRHAQDALEAQAESFRKALDAASATAHDNALAAGRTASQMLSTAESLDGRLDAMVKRGEQQRAVLNGAADQMKAQVQALDDAMGHHAAELARLAQAAAEQTIRAQAAGEDAARRIDGFSAALDGRTKALAASVGVEAARVSDAAAAAEARLNQAASAAVSGGETMRAVYEQTASGAQAAAETLQRQAQATLAAFEKGLEALRTQALSVHTEMNAALARAQAEPANGRGATRPGSTGERGWAPFAKKLAPGKKREAAGERQDWRISEALAAADATRAVGTSSATALHQESVRVIEILQALSIDLAKGLGEDLPGDLWKRYLAGERGVFTRRLIELIGREGAQAVATRHAQDTSFRQHADRYMAEFEKLLDAAQPHDRDQILTETYLTSQAGRLYLLLAAATERL